MIIHRMNKEKKFTGTSAMIRLHHSEYFLPTKMFRQLSVMLAMQHEPDLRQQGIAEKVNMSGAMVNGYIKQMKRAGFIHVKEKNRRDYEYLLTQAGREKLVFHLMECSAEIVQLYSQAKRELIARLSDFFAERTLVRVMLYGGSDTGCLVVEALENLDNVKVVAVVDSDSMKWGTAIGSYVVQGPAILEQIMVDYVIISSFARQDEIYNLLLKIPIAEGKILKLSMLV